MIVSLHVATGAVGGLVAGTPARAAVVGPILHLLGDRMPHEDIHSYPFEIASGVVGVVALALVRGPLDPATVGALAASAPDVEHAVRLPRPGGRKLFPSHRIQGWHRPDGLSAATQLLLAGALFGTVLGAGLRGYIDRAGR
jgi:hypothetical protein